MSITKYILSFILGAIIACIFIFFTVDKENILQSIQAFGSLGILFGAVIAFMTYKLHEDSKKKDEKIAKSKINLDLALEFLKHAYETLTNNNPNVVPKNDRLLWLTCARQILASEEMYEKIYHPEHQDVYKEYKDYWRTKLYSLLDQYNEELDVRYFEGEKGQHLDEKSLAVVFKFIEWDKERVDKVLDRDELLETEAIEFRGLHRYLKDRKKA